MDLIADPVFLVELVMLSALLAAGLYLSYTDVKYRQVANRFTLSLLAVGLGGQLLLVYLGVTSWSRVGAVFLLGLGLALGLILLGFWAPGDAKLFWAASVALPPTLCPSGDPFSWQAAPEALLLNALLCYLLVLLLVPLWKRQERRREPPDRGLERPWLAAAWGLAGLLGLALGVAVLVLERPLSYLEALAALVIGYRLLERGLERKYWPIILLPGLFLLLYLGYSTGGMQAYVLLWGAAWLIEGVYLQVRYWYGRAFVQLFPVALLQPGAISRYSISLQEGGNRPVCVEGEEGAGERLCRAGRPLSEQQVFRLRHLAQQAALPRGDMLELEQSIPFVPFIVVSAVLTAIFSGHLVPPLTRLVVWLGG